jgi:phosphatidylserine synthase
MAVRPLVGTRVTPNHLTTLRLATGLAAAGALAVGASPWQHVGAALFVVSLVLDRADGELARLAGKTTPWGHAYDLIADATADALVFVGLGVGLRESALGVWAIPMGVAAGAAVAAVFWLIMRIEAVEGQRAAELPSVAGFDVDDSILIVPVAVWLGGSVPLLVAATIGAPAFAVFFVRVLLRRRAAAGAAES